jgi:hypothetical protein
MFHLLPDSDKKILHREYNARVLLVILGFVFLTILVAGILLLPSYVLTRSREQVALARDQDLSQSSKVQQGQTVNTTLTNDQTLLTVLAPATASTTESFSAIVQTVATDASSDAKIDSFFYSASPQAPVTVTINGMGTSRESLVAFSHRLENEPAFASVVLPVSDLAQDSNIPFSIQIILK